MALNSRFSSSGGSPKRRMMRPLDSETSQLLVDSDHLRWRLRTLAIYFAAHCSWLVDRLSTAELPFTCDDPLSAGSGVGKRSADGKVSAKNGLPINTLFGGMQLFLISLTLTGFD